jgi:hypothetical protein
MSDSCGYRLLSGSVPCARLITRPEESYRVCVCVCVCVSVIECDVETSTNRRPRPTRNCGAMDKKKITTVSIPPLLLLTPLRDAPIHILPNYLKQFEQLTSFLKANASFICSHFVPQNSSLLLCVYWQFISRREWHSPDMRLRYS